MVEPPQPASVTAERFEALDALRGICALLVALYHFRANGLLANLPFVENGWLFVDYFFVLSGFVIAHSYGARLADREISIGRFMGLRLGRIYPLHVAVLGGFIAIEIALLLFRDTLGPYVSRAPFSASREPLALLQSVLLLQSFGLPGAAGWNGPAWSIAAEVWTYLLFAMVFLADRRMMLLLAGGLALGAALWLNSFATDLHVTYRGGLLRCIYGFGAGVLTYHAFRRFGGRGGNLWEVAAIVLVGAFVSTVHGKLTFLAPAVFAGMVFVMASQRGAVSRMLSIGALQRLGLISYSIYMVHVFVQGRLGELLQASDMAPVSVDHAGRTILQGTPLLGDALTIAMLAVVVLVAELTYRLVERPGRTWSRRWLAAAGAADRGQAVRRAGRAQCRPRHRAARGFHRQAGKVVVATVEAGQNEEKRRCRICGAFAQGRCVSAHEMMFGTRERFDYWLCPDCGTLQIVPVPGDLARHYSASRYYSFNNSLRQDRARTWLKRLALRGMVGRPDRFPTGDGILDRIRRGAEPWVALVPGLRRDSRILDLGCGDGARLAVLARLGFTRLTGIDAFLPDARVGHPVGGVRLVRGTLADMRGEFDCITMHHSLEHLPDPGAALEQARRLIAPGGSILVRIPLLQPELWARFGSNWAQLDAPRHLYLFTPAGMLDLARRAGLECIASGCDMQGWSLAWSEAYAQGIAMHDQSGRPNRLPFPVAQLRQLEREARALNACGQGDQGYFVLRPAARAGDR